MVAVIDFVQNAFLLTVIFVIVVIAIIYYRWRYKVASAGQALVITGGKKEPKILPGGGAFVSPNRKHDFFPIGVMTVSSPDQETQTSTMVPIVVKWTAQLRVGIDQESLQKATRGFDSYKAEDISTSLRQTLDGEVRAVVATMTPEAVVTDKVTFAEQVTSGVSQRMTDLGYSLISLNISEVSDKNGYYTNLAAADREQQRQEAETLTAQANQRVAVETAKSDQASREAELDRDLAVDEKSKDVKLRQAEIKTETDTAEANAAIAGALQTELRNQDLATRQGEVAVIKAQQEQAAAIAQREAELTRAETAKQRRVIDASAEAQQAEIDANAAAAVATAQATGDANAAKERARGEADALELIATAEANRVRVTGQAEADADKARGQAEADAILAKGEAEAEVQRKMAEALAAHNGANLQVTLAEIQRDTTIEVSSAFGKAMASVGEKATFIDMGGSSNGEGDLLSRVLGNVPSLLKRLDVQSMALNGEPFGESVGSVVSAIGGKSPSDEQDPDQADGSLDDAESVDEVDSETPDVSESDEQVEEGVQEDSDGEPKAG